MMMVPPGVEVRNIAVPEEAPSAAAPDQVRATSIAAGAETDINLGGGGFKADCTTSLDALGKEVAEEDDDAEFSIRAATQKVSIGMDLFPGKQGLVEGANTANEAAVRSTAAAAAPSKESIEAEESAEANVPFRAQAKELTAVAHPAGMMTSTSVEDVVATVGLAGAKGSSGRTRREQRRPMRLTDLADGPQFSTKKSRNASRKGMADAAVSHATGMSRKGVKKKNTVRAKSLLSRAGPTTGPTVNSAKEKMRPHKKLASIYVRAPNAIKNESLSSESDDKETEEDGTTEAVAAAGLMAVAAGKDMPNLKRKRASDASKARGAEIFAAKPSMVGNALDAAQLAHLAAFQRQLEARNGGGSSWVRHPADWEEPWRRLQGSTWMPTTSLDHAQYAMARQEERQRMLQTERSDGGSKLSECSVGEILSRFYKYMPPARGRVDPRFHQDVTQIFRNTVRPLDPALRLHLSRQIDGRPMEQSRGRGFSSAMEGRDVGNHANMAAALQWQRNMMQHIGAGNMTPHGSFVMDPKDMRFKPPPNWEAYQASVQNSRMQLSKLNQMMEWLLPVIAAVSMPIPAQVRNEIVKRVQRLLEEILKSAPQMTAAEHGPLIHAVTEVQLWVQRQLKERMDDILVNKSRRSTKAKGKRGDIGRRETEPPPLSSIKGSRDGASVLTTGDLAPTDSPRSRMAPGGATAGPPCNTDTNDTEVTVDVAALASLCDAAAASAATLVNDDRDQSGEPPATEGVDARANGGEEVPATATLAAS